MWNILIRITMVEELLPFISHHHHHLMNQGDKKTAAISQKTDPDSSTTTTKIAYDMQQGEKKRSEEAEVFTILVKNDNEKSIIMSIVFQLCWSYNSDTKLPQLLGDMVESGKMT